ncbi:CENP-B-like protein [Smittium culicis]|uniref:CENP-B-like protein n=1 Tax=Smittium culicis TaxID=133412 RepID=A0A1R1X8H3_9FUNG|nr:CENP-B-like protein [Smittium culicis]
MESKSLINDSSSTINADPSNINAVAESASIAGPEAKILESMDTDLLDANLDTHIVSNTEKDLVYNLNIDNNQSEMKAFDSDNEIPVFYDSNHSPADSLNNLSKPNKLDGSELDLHLDHQIQITKEEQSPNSALTQPKANEAGLFILNDKVDPLVINSSIINKRPYPEENPDITTTQDLENLQKPQITSVDSNKNKKKKRKKNKKVRKDKRDLGKLDTNPTTTVDIQFAEPQIYEILDSNDDCDIRSTLFVTPWLYRFYSNNNSMFYKPRFSGGSTGGVNKKIEKNIPFIHVNTKIQFSESYLSCLSKYSSKNIFSVSFAGIFYRLLPSVELSKIMLDGEGVPNEKMASILCCNSDGSEKMPLWILNSNLSTKSVIRSQSRINATIESHKDYQNSLKSPESLDSNRTEHKNTDLASSLKGQKINIKSSSHKNVSENYSKDDSNKKAEPNSDPNDNVFDDDDPFYFRYNSESSISHTIFLEWLHWFDARVSGRKVVLLLSEEFLFPSTDIPFLNNVKLLYIPDHISNSPKNLDLKLSWKLSYRLRYYDYLLSKFGISTTVFNNGIRFKKIGVNNSVSSELISAVDAAYLLTDAWNLGVHSNLIISNFKRLYDFAVESSPRINNSLELENNTFNIDSYAHDDLSFIELENQIDLLQFFFKNIPCDLENVPNDVTFASSKPDQLVSDNKTFFDFYKIKLYSKLPTTYPKLYKKQKTEGADKILESICKYSLSDRLDLGILINFPLENQVTTSDFDDLSIVNMFIADNIFEMRCTSKPDKIA